MTTTIEAAIAALRGGRTMSDTAMLKARLENHGSEIIQRVREADRDMGLAAARIAKLEAERDRLKAVLKPFADIVANKQPNGKTYTLVRVDACEAAAAALSPSPSGE